MKKLFSIFCCLLLSVSMVTQAQVNSTSHEVNVKGTVKVTRHNAPQAVQDWNWTGDLEASDIDSWSVSDWTDKLYLEVVTNCCGTFGFEFKTTDRDYDVDGNLIIPAGVYIMADNGSAVEGNAINGYTTDEINGCFQFTDGNNWWIFDSGKVTVTKPDGRMSVNLYAWDDGNNQNNFNVYPPDNTIRQNQTINLSITNSNFTQSGDQFIFDATSSDGYRVRIRVRSSVIEGTYPTSKIRFFGNNTKETFVTLPNSTIKEMDMGQAQVTQTDGRYSIDAYITSTDRIEYHIVGTPISYSVSVASNDASLGTVNSAGGSYLFGANSGTFTASATIGIFDGWYLDGNKVNSSTSNYTLSNGGLSIQLLNLQSNHTLEARFNVSGGSYAVNYGVSPVGAGSITSAKYGDAPGTPFDSGDVLAGGSSVTLTAGNNSGYRFDKWSNNVTANPYTFLLSKDTTLTAQFIKTYVITVTSSVGGSATGSGTYDVGMNASLTATSTNEHLYIFDHWLKDGNNYAGGTTITPTVTANATYTAVFRAANAGTITGYANPLYGSAAVSPSGSQAGGTAVTLTVTPNSGYMFVQWEDGNTDNPRTVYVDGDATYTAQFAVETPLCGSVKYNTANHEIIWEKHGDQDWASAYMTWNSANDMFVRVRASDYTDNSMNHIQLCFWVDDFSVTYNGTIGPKAGTYTVVQPYVAGWNSGNNYWDLDASYLNNAVVGSDPDYVIGGWRTDLNMIWTTSHSPYCAYIANQTCDYCSPTDFLGVPVGSTVKVAKGEGGNCYVEVRNALGRLLFTIGDPATTPVTHALAWDANGGELSGTYTAAGSVNEGTSITAPTATRTGYTFTGWSPAFTGTMPSANTTYVAQWTANTHNVSWVTDGNALTGSYTNGTTAYGTTIVAPETPTKNATAQYTYTFNGWTPAVDATMPDNDVTYTATWTQAKVQYTLTWDFAGGTTATAEDNYTHGLIDWGTVITAPANPTRDGYTFNGWNETPAENMPAANTTYTANWTEKITTYSVQFLAGDHGKSVSATAGGSDIESGITPVPANTSVTLTAEPRNFYHFVAWVDSDTPSDTLSKEKEYTFTLSDNVNLTAVFARDETIILEDNHKTKAVDPAEEWYEDYVYLLEDLDGATVNVLYKRTMNPNTWCVFALPFDYSLRSSSSVLKGKVYELGEFIYTTTGMTLNFPPVGQRIEANKPYLFYSSGNDKTTDLVFNNVRLQPIANNSYSINNSGEGNVGGRIIFNATTSYVRLDEGKDEDAKKKTIYLSGNRLYYLNTENASWMRAFRGYFTLDAELQYLPPRVRIVLEGQTTTEVEVVTDTRDNSGNVRKYIENGVLVIEREGVRYDATGARRN